LAGWALAFFLYSIAGWCWEVGLYLVQERRFVNRGFLSGPMLPIYGFGALTILAVCFPVRESIWLTALAGMAAASALEYISGAAIEAVFHVRYWDYSEETLNLHGHICLKAALTWAAFSVLLVRVVHPVIESWIVRIPPAVGLALSGVLALFALGDTVVNVRRALDLRALLMMMNRFGAQLDALADVMEMGVQERVELRRRRAHKIIRRNPRVTSRRYRSAVDEIKKGAAVHSHTLRRGII